MGVEGEIAYSYFDSKFHDPSLEGWHVGLDILDLRVVWVIVKGGADGG